MQMLLFFSLVSLFMYFFFQYDHKQSGRHICDSYQYAIIVYCSMQQKSFCLLCYEQQEQIRSSCLLQTQLFTKQISSSFILLTLIAHYRSFLTSSYTHTHTRTQHWREKSKQRRILLQKSKRGTQQKGNDSRKRATSQTVCLVHSMYTQAILYSVCKKNSKQAKSISTPSTCIVGKSASSKLRLSLLYVFIQRKRAASWLGLKENDRFLFEKARCIQCESVSEGLQYTYAIYIRRREEGENHMKKERLW